MTSNVIASKLSSAGLDAAVPELKARGVVEATGLSALPFANLMPDSGRFAGYLDEPLSVYLGTSVFTPSPFLASYNGAVVTEAGKFIHNNSTNGGSNGALNEPVTSLLTALGRTGLDARYGPEFYVARYTAGTGTGGLDTGADGVVRYLMTANNSAMLAAFGGMSTCMFWVRVVTGSAHTTIPTKVDGVDVGMDVAFPEGWHHIRANLSSLRGYDGGTGFPSIRATHGAVLEIALPAFFPGDVGTGLHTSPLPAAGKGGQVYTQTEKTQVAEMYERMHNAQIEMITGAHYLC